jgi:NAD(P) transhydrogenase subunit beta
MDEKPGYSGVENPLYSNANTIMMLGDARQTTKRMIATLQAERS